MQGLPGPPLIDESFFLATATARLVDSARACHSDFGGFPTSVLPVPVLVLVLGLVDGILGWLGGAQHLSHLAQDGFARVEVQCRALPAGASASTGGRKTAPDLLQRWIAEAQHHHVFHVDAGHASEARQRSAEGKALEKHGKQPHGLVALRVRACPLSSNECPKSPSAREFSLRRRLGRLRNGRE